MIQKQAIWIIWVFIVGLSTSLSAGASPFSLDADSCGPYEEFVCSEEFENDCWCQNSSEEEKIEQLTLESNVERKIRERKEAQNSCLQSGGDYQCNDYTDECSCQQPESAEAVAAAKSPSSNLATADEAPQSESPSAGSYQEQRLSCESGGGQLYCDQYSGSCECNGGTQDSTLKARQTEEAKATDSPTDSETGDPSAINRVGKGGEDTGKISATEDDKYAGLKAQLDDLLTCDYQRTDQQEDLSKDIESCLEDRKRTANFCEAGGNKTLNNALSMIQQAARAINLGGAMSPQAACSDFGKISRVGLGALTAYRAACAPVKKICEDSCKEAVDGYQKAYEEIKKQHEKLKEFKDEADIRFVEWLQKRHGIELEKAQNPCVASFKETFYKVHDPKSLRGKSDEVKDKSIFIAHKLCKGYGKDLLMAAVDAGAIYASVKQSEKCDADVAETPKGFCEQYPDSPACPQAAGVGNCTDNPTSAHCICQTNPQDPICLAIAGSTSTASTRNSIPSSVSGVSGIGDLGSGSPGSGSGAGGASADSSSNGSASLAGSPFASPGIAPVGTGQGANGGGANVKTIPNGGGANLGSGGGGTGSGASARGRRSRGRSSSLSTSSGGGGFARSRKGTYAFKAGGSAKPRRVYRPTPDKGFHRGKGGPEMVDLRKYLPGGSLDPNRRKRRVHGFAKEDGITGANGPSLFEKVTRRYDKEESSLFQDAPRFRYKVQRRRTSQAN